MSPANRGCSSFALAVEDVPMIVPKFAPMRYMFAGHDSKWSCLDRLRITMINLQPNIQEVLNG